MIKKIYVCIPGNKVTGGPETLHQFADEASRYCCETYVYYYGEEKKYNIPDKYKIYHVKIALQIEDTSDNLIIVPEVALNLLAELYEIKKCVWWLSIDYYYNMNYRYKNSFKISNGLLPRRCLAYVKSVMIFLYRKLLGKLYTIDCLENDVFHLYNSEYARQFLKKHGIKEEKMAYLCGPLEKMYFEPVELSDVLEKKENIVAYNCSKGLRYVRLIEKKNACGYEFVPIINLSSQEVKKLLMRSKIYVDFGFFPGPERIPRQAVMCYCSLLTSTSGSAANEIDIPIPACNKIELKHFNAKKVYKRVEKLMDSFDDDVHIYDNYRNKVKQQNAEFEKGVREFIQQFTQGD